MSTVYKGYRDCRDNVVVWVLNRCISGKGENMKTSMFVLFRFRLSSLRIMIGGLGFRIQGSRF